MKHYTLEELNVYNTDKMSLTAKMECSTHLSNCSECNALLAQIKAHERLIAQLKKSWATLDSSHVDERWEQSYNQLSKILK